jgi:glycosyltransferase involved in cell wall biosynthesis
MTRISVVTISYNQCTWLAPCLESVLGQKQPGDQYVVVDPGSTDGSRQLIVRHAGIDVMLFEPDRGPADGLNKGFSHCDGDVLGYINADDRYHPRAFEFVRDFFERHPDVDVLCGAGRIIDTAGQPSPRKRTSDRFDLRRYAAQACTIVQQATFFRRDAFLRAGGFNTLNRISWDAELLVDMALTGARFQSVRRVLGDFRIHSTSITGSGKFLDKLYEEHARIAAKIASRGISLFSPHTERMVRLAYKLDISRHLGYMLVD